MEITTSTHDATLDDLDAILTPDRNTRQFECERCQDFGVILAYGADTEDGTIDCPECGTATDGEIPY